MNTSVALSPALSSKASPTNASLEASPHLT